MLPPLIDSQKVSPLHHFRCRDFDHIRKAMPESITYSLPSIRLRAIAWCNKAERCQQDMRQKLIAWKVSGKDSEILIAELISLDLINENRFACAFASDKSRLNGWGVNKIKSHLKLRGISEPNIRAALAQIDPGDSLERALDFARKKNRSLAHEKPIVKKAKVYRSLISKGFDQHTIGKVMNALNLDPGED